MGVTAGVAVNIADPEGSMFFPPVTGGIVPDAVAWTVRTRCRHGGEATGGSVSCERRWQGGDLHVDPASVQKITSGLRATVDELEEIGSGTGGRRWARVCRACL